MSATTSPLDAIPDVLRRVSNPGRFWGAGAVPLPVLDLQVRGVGRLGLPLAPEQSLRLWEAGTAAPYGKGPATLVDENVRRCRQIAAAAVSINPTRWSPLLATVVEAARTALGIEAPVVAELYKLLVYQEGDFFLPHRDSEKAPGMIATLVVALPADHEGGVLRIQHGDEEATVSFEGAEIGTLPWVAFYTDCLHELRPITRGYRVALVYNLNLAQPAGRARSGPPQHTAEVAELQRALSAWPSGPAAPAKGVYLLSHRYTSAELSWASLKNEDAARAQVLRAAAEASDCVLHLAMVSIAEYGSAMETWNPHARSRSRRWSERIEPPEDTLDYEVIDVHERVASVELCTDVPIEWSTAPSMPLHDEELLPPDALEDEPPDESHYHEASGNEGATFERTYRRAALVFWPRANDLALSIEAGPEYVAERLQALLKQASPQARAQAVTLVAVLTRSPQAHTDAGIRPSAVRAWHRELPTAVGAILRALARWSDSGVIGEFLTRVAVPLGLQSVDTAALAEALATRPEAERTAHVQALVHTTLTDQADRYVRDAEGEDTPIHAHTTVAMFLLALHAECPGGWLRTVCSTWVRMVSLDRSARFDDPDEVDDLEVVDGHRAPAEKPIFPSTSTWLVEMVGVLAALGALDLVEEALARCLKRPDHYGLDEVVVPAVLTHLPGAAPALRLAMEAAHAASVAHLKQRIDLPLAPPADQVRSTEGLDCRCAECGVLRTLLRNRSDPRFEFRVNEERRNHLTWEVRRSGAEVDLKVVRTGRPYGLLATKNQRRYQARVRQRALDLRNFDVLTSAVNANPANGEMGVR